jgi:hypothetical protein
MADNKRLDSAMRLVETDAMLQLNGGRGVESLSLSARRMGCAGLPHASMALPAYQPPLWMYRDAQHEGAIPR